MRDLEGPGRLIFDNLKRGAVAGPKRSCIQQVTDGDDRLPMFSDDLADIALSKLQPKESFFRTLDLCQNHLLWKVNELPKHEIEKLLHDGDSGKSFAGEGQSRCFFQ